MKNSIFSLSIHRAALSPRHNTRSVSCRHHWWKKQAPPPHTTILEPPRPVITEQQLADAKQESYRQGFLDGERDGRAQAEAAHGSINEDIHRTVEAVAAQMQPVFGDIQQWRDAQAASLPRLALAVAKKVAGEALQADALPLIERLVHECLAKTMSTPEIIITVADAMVAGLEEKLGKHFEGSNEPGEITISGDAAMQPGDCRIEWNGGAAMRDTSQLWQTIETGVEAHLPPTPPMVDTTAETPDNPQTPPLEENPNG